MTFGSLFSGIGGIDLGLERAGFQHGDITKLDGRELEYVDVLAGGFPCQDLSQAGKRAGIEGSRSGLWFEFARLIGQLRPRFVLIENVPGLLVPGAMSRVVGELARLGYVGCWRSLRASEFGASHLRKRVFIVAYRQCERGERWRGPGIVGGQKGQEPSEGHQRERDGDAADDSGATVADSERPQCDGSAGSWVRTNGRPLQTARSSESDGCMANSRLAGERRPAQSAGQHRERASGDDSGASGTLEHPARDEQSGLPGQDRRMRRRGVCETGESMADSGNGLIQEQWRGPEGRNGPRSAGPFAPGPGDPRWPDILREWPWLAPALPHPVRKHGDDAGHGAGAVRGERSESPEVQQSRETPPESPLRQLADGISSGLDGNIELAMKDRTKRLGRLGNAVVPQVAEWVGRRILEFHRSTS